MNPLLIFKRAFNGNLGTIAITDAERTKLEARGISEPVAQRYFVWRNAMLLMVIIATVLSSVLTTVNDLRDTGEEPNILESLTGKLTEAVDGALPEGAADAADAAKDIGGKKTDAAAEEEEKPVPEHQPNAFEKFTDIVQSAALYTLVGSAVLAFIFRNRPKLSFRILVAGFLFGFFVPIAIALCPWSWFGFTKETISPMKDPTGFLKTIAEDGIEAAKMLVSLLPAVLALIPGVLKGCLRVKTLLPASTLPGWFIVMTAPLYALFLLAVFVAINQVTNDPLLIGGVLLLVAAHLVYAFRASSFTQPILDDGGFARMKNSQRMVMLFTLGAVGLVVTYLTTRSFMGAHIIGMNPAKAFVTPWDLAGMGMEIISRSMFVGVLGVDLFVRINMTAWNDVKRLAEPGGIGNYQNTMDAMTSALK